jgi:hypothetical protein
LFKIQSNYWTTLKAFMLYLNIITPEEIPQFDASSEVFKKLKEL